MKRDVHAFAAILFVTTLLVGGTLVHAIRTESDSACGTRVKETAVLTVASETLIKSSSDYLGNPKAAYVLVEFADYQCPPCRKASETIQELLTRNPNVRLAFRNFPLKIHPYAFSAAVAAEAAREQGAFWQVHDALFENQQQLNDRLINDVAIKHHLDLPRFQKASTGAARRAVEKDIELAHILG